MWGGAGICFLASIMCLVVGGCTGGGRAGSACWTVRGLTGGVDGEWCPSLRPHPLGAGELRWWPRTGVVTGGGVGACTGVGVGLGCGSRVRGLAGVAPVAVGVVAGERLCDVGGLADPGGWGVPPLRLVLVLLVGWGEVGEGLGSLVVVLSGGLLAVRGCAGREDARGTGVVNGGACTERRGVGV